MLGFSKSSIAEGPRVVHPHFDIDLLDVLSEKSWQFLS